MMYSEQIASAVCGVRIHSYTTFSWFGRRSVRVPVKLRDALSETERRRFLTGSLQAQLYSGFYCQGMALPRTEEEEAVPSGTAEPAFLHRLSTANQGTGHLDPSWIVCTVLGETIRVMKHELELTATPDQCVANGPLLEGIEVSLRCGKELLGMSPGFYMALSDAPGALEDDHGLVRLYWNATPHGAVAIMRLVTDRLNRVGQPFRLKALNDPASYGRNDAVVLYIPLSTYRECRRDLEEVHGCVERYLRPGIPALTKMLAHGLGLAEDPVENTSFGLHRCGIIAEGLVSAWERGLDGDRERCEAVLEYLAEREIRIDSPYLNAGSEDRYEFDPGRAIVRGVSVSYAPRTERSVVGEAWFDIAHAIGVRLVDSAITHGERTTWFGYFAERPEAAITVRQSMYNGLGPDLYAGTAGVAWFLAKLYDRTGVEAFRTAASGAIQHAMSRLDSIQATNRLALYTGWTGVALAAAYVGRLLDAGDVVNQARGLISQLLAEPGKPQGFDLITGSAGTIIGLLSFWDLEHDDEILARAYTLGLDLAENGDRTGLTQSWSPGPGARHPNLTGLSHGAAGGGWSLLELFAAVKDTRLREAAERAFERTWFDPENENWADLRHHPRRNGKARPPFNCLTFWCHGAPGIGLSRLRAYQLLRTAIYEQEALAAARTTTHTISGWLRDPSSDLSLCHGLAGAGLILLEAAHVLSGEPIRAGLAAVRAAAGTAADIYGSGEHSWPCGAGPGENPSLMLGLAGIGEFFLALDEHSTDRASFGVTPIALRAAGAAPRPMLA
jgi:hypothetical protein